MATANVPSRPKTIIVVKLVVYYTTEKKEALYSLSEEANTKKSREVSQKGEFFMSFPPKLSVKVDAWKWETFFLLFSKLDFVGNYVLCSQILALY